MRAFIIEMLLHHKKALFVLCLVVAMTWAVLNMSVNTFLSTLKNSVATIANDELTYTFAVQDLVYKFPNKIIAQDILIHPPDHKEIVVVRMPKVEAKFSLSKLIFGKEAAVTKVLIEDTFFRWQNFCQFVRENHLYLMEVIKKIPKADIKMKVDETVVKLVDNNFGPDHLDVDFVFEIDRDDVSITGTIGMEYEPHVKGRKLPIDKLVKYEFKSLWTEEAFFIDSIVFSGQNLYSKLWGKVQDDDLNMKGFCFINTSQSRIELAKRSKPLNIIERVRLFLQLLKGGKTPANEMPQCNVYLTDFDVLVKTDFPQIDVERFDLRFNNAPIFLGGRIVLSDPPVFDLKTSFYPAFSNDEGMGDLKQADFYVSGKLENDAFYVDSDLKLQFADSQTEMGTLSIVDLDLNNLMFDFYHYPDLQIGLKKGSALWNINGNEHEVKVSGLAAATVLDDKRIKEVEMKASAYEGSAEGKLLIDTGYIPFHFTAEAALKDLDAHKLKKLVEYFSKVYGRLDGDIVFRSYPGFDLKGEIDITDGHLINYDFFKWMSDTFGMISLLDVGFYKANTKFVVDPSQAGIYDIDLKAQDVQISGNFYLKKDEMASGIVSMSLSRRQIAESDNFRPILKFFEPGTAFLDFDFQISGPFETMNFRWLPNWTKERIRQRIPDFIERIIERKVEREMR